MNTSALQYVILRGFGMLSGRQRKATVVKVSRGFQTVTVRTTDGRESKFNAQTGFPTGKQEFSGYQLDIRTLR
jgi:hypothetical protein